jgi:hypothetical protein
MKIENKIEETIHLYFLGIMSYFFTNIILNLSLKHKKAGLQKSQLI